MGHGFDFLRFIEALTAVAAVIVPVWWSEKRARERQHQENTAKLEMLLDEQNERPSHRHTERSGTLTVEGILFAPRTNGKH